MGNATRAFQCTGALDWHLDHDTLVWSNKKGDSSIRSLRTHNGNVPITSHTTSIDIRNFGIPFTSMNNFQLTEDDNMIVDLQGEGSGQKLMKLTKQGAVLWPMDVPSLLSMIAVGKNAVFFSQLQEQITTFVYRAQHPDRYCRAMPNESDKMLVALL